ncbi:reverse transcriptase domain-containing protein [Tanacetum coccineum]
MPDYRCRLGTVDGIPAMQSTQKNSEEPQGTDDAAAETAQPTKYYEYISASMALGVQKERQLDPLVEKINVFRIMTNEVAYAMTWSDLKKKMTTKYCPRNEIKKIEVELWNLKVKGTDVVAYNQRFQELALLCDRMFPEETDKIERYCLPVGCPIRFTQVFCGSKPKTMRRLLRWQRIDG